MSQAAHRDQIKALLAAMGRPSVVAETEVELEALTSDDPRASRALAASVLVMAHELDSPKPSLAMKAMAARELRDTLDRIRELAPPKRREDSVDKLRDDLAAKRAAKTPAVRRRAAPKAQQPS